MCICTVFLMVLGSCSMAEDATNGDTWPPDTRAIGVISRAAFEVDDYGRIVEIMHTRLI